MYEFISLAMIMSISMCACTRARYEIHENNELIMGQHAPSFILNSPMLVHDKDGK